MQTSEQINEIATALAKAQGEITGALKDSANPFFKSKYADLASCWDACRGPLSANGLAVVQIPGISEDATRMVLETRLMHSSGQWISSLLPIHPKDESPQAMGSALTYARRYALTAMVGVAQVDDDGNAASGKSNPVSEIHSPKGDMGKDVDPKLAAKEAGEMNIILGADIEDDVKCLHVADKNDELNKDKELFVATWGLLPSATRKAWKTYVDMAKKAEARERVA